MTLEILDILFILIIIASTIWVFFDARQRTNYPFLWSVVTLFGFYPLGFIFYIARVRNKAKIIDTSTSTTNNKSSKKAKGATKK